MTVINKDTLSAIFRYYVMYMYILLSEVTNLHRTELLQPVNTYNDTTSIGSVGLDEGLPVYTVVSGAAIKRCYCQRKCHIRVTVRDENSCDVKLRDIADLHVKVNSHYVISMSLT